MRFLVTAAMVMMATVSVFGFSPVLMADNHQQNDGGYNIMGDNGNIFDLRGSENNQIFPHQKQRNEDKRSYHQFVLNPPPALEVVPADITPPIITLLGESPMVVTVGDVFTDPGAEATDDVDGNVRVSTISVVNADEAGTYSVTYTAEDAAGNVATKARNVTVEPAPWKWEWWWLLVPVVAGAVLIAYLVWRRRGGEESEGPKGNDPDPTPGGGDSGVIDAEYTIIPLTTGERRKMLTAGNKGGDTAAVGAPPPRDTLSAAAAKAKELPGRKKTKRAGRRTRSKRS